MPFSELLYDVQRGEKALMSYANSECPYECAHPCSLMRTVSVRRHILQYLLILVAGNGGPYQPAQMCRLIRAYVVRKMYVSFSCDAHQLCDLRKRRPLVESMNIAP